MASNPFVSIALFSQFSGVNDPAQDELFTLYLNSAQDVVERYLGFPLERRHYSHAVFGIGSNLIALKAIAVENLVLGDADVRVLSISGNIVVLDKDVAVGKEIPATYDAGFTTDTIPEAIRLTMMRIAGLMWSEEGGNVAITGKSFGSDGGRTFIATRDYSRFLQEIEPYRVI